MRLRTYANGARRLLGAAQRGEAVEPAAQDLAALLRFDKAAGPLHDDLRLVLARAAVAHALRNLGLDGGSSELERVLHCDQRRNGALFGLWDPVPGRDHQ